MANTKHFRAEFVTFESHIMMDIEEPLRRLACTKLLP
jgi:hypothetical protein